MAVLAADPFMAPDRRAGAEWFAAIWDKFDIQPGAHLRRIHYLLVSQDPSVLMVSGKPYLNDEQCWKYLGRTSLDARYLGLVDPRNLVDRRNPDPKIYGRDETEKDAVIEVAEGFVDEATTVTAPELTLPCLDLGRPTILQPYRVEIWCEKSTVNDVLLPLGEQYGLTIVTGAGEISHTRCVEFVDRAIADGRPARILYLSDFDPAGASMPVAVARKIEHLLHTTGGGRDVQVRPVVLTHEQCQRYQLPRTPIKEGEKRAARFEERFGVGATELDALEALHPGELRRILKKEILRYYDKNLVAAINDVADQVTADLTELEERVHAEFADRIAAIEAEHEEITTEITALQEREAELKAAFAAKARPVLDEIAEALIFAAPAAEDYAWPAPRKANEDEDPLFNSMRSYLDQVDRYKSHQGRPTRRRSRPRKYRFTECIVCGETFRMSRDDATTCSPRCRKVLSRKAVTDKSANA